MRTQGIDGTHYPIIKVMLDRRPDLLHAKIDEEHFLLEEMMKANVAYTREIMSLQECGYLHGAFRVHNSLFRNKGWRELPDGLYACVDMTKIPVLPLFRFLYEQDMIGADVFPHRFHMGIGMVVAVPADKCREAMQVIGLTGKPGGKMKAKCDITIVVPWNKYSDRIQEIHIKIIHILIEYIEQALFNTNK